MAKRKAKVEAEDDFEEEFNPVEFFNIMCGDKVKAGKVEFDWQGMLVANSVNVIDGYKGVGKSSLLAKLGAMLCNGIKFPDTKSKPRKGKCLWIGTEESFHAAILPRWLANGGKASDILTINYADPSSNGRMLLPDQGERFTRMLIELKIRCLALDPFSSLLNPVIDTRNEQQMRLYMQCLAAACAEAKTTAILTRHFKKGKSGNLLDLGIGSVAIGNVARCVLRADRDPDEPGTCYLTAIACNAGKAEGSMSYTMLGNASNVFAVKLGKRVDLDLEDILEGDETPDFQDESLDAETLLTRILANGKQTFTTIFAEAKDAGIGLTTLRKVKKRLKVKSKRIVKSKGEKPEWYWLPSS